LPWCAEETSYKSIKNLTDPKPLTGGVHATQPNPNPTLTLH